MERVIFLYGAPASGKSTLGRLLSGKLGAEFVDLDEEIVRKAGKPIPEIFAESGEGVFRDVESETLASTLAALRSGRSAISVIRSEERRVGKECIAVCRSRWSPYH